jgi:hypothetical protein
MERLMRPARMHVTKLDAGKSQLATAIRLYFEDCDPVSVHTLVMAANEIIERLCESEGTPAIRNSFLAMIIPEWRRKFGRHLNKARNFFKHASDHDEVLEDFSDEQNLVGIVMAVHGLLLLGVDMLEARLFTAWVRLVEPELFLDPLPRDLIGTYDATFDPDYFRNLSRAEQKQSGLAALHRAPMGAFPDVSSFGAAKNPFQPSE